MITKYEDFCIICARPKQHIHHLVFGNAKRRLADEDGLTCPVCMEHHEMFHTDRSSQVMSHIIGQLLYERDRCAEGATVDEARAMFRQRYSVSYL